MNLICVQSAVKS